MADFRASSYLDIVQGGYPGEDIYPNADSYWHQDYNAGESGSHTETYYYTDSNYIYGATPAMTAAFLNANSSRVYFKVTDEWTSEKLSNNRVKIHLKTTLSEISRGGIQGNPNGGGTAPRRLTVQMGDAWSNTWPSLNIGIAETIMPNPLVIERDIYLEPESSRGQSSLYVYNKTVGYDGPGDTDEIGCGVTFTNLLPKEISHRLVYHYNNGQPNKVVDFTDKNECTTTTLDSWAPTRQHWIFKGWSTSSSASSVTHQPGDSIGVCEETHVYAVWEYTYRPGMHRVNGVWMSCDRDGVSGPLGRANVLFDSKWIEMRIRSGTNVGLSDPPCIKKGSWVKMQLIGQDGQPHDISWNCPHQWNR